jgi:hypothetical protein
VAGRRGAVGLNARAARAELEAALDGRGWPGSLLLSRWLDALLILEEHGA